MANKVGQGMTMRSNVDEAVVEERDCRSEVDFRFCHSKFVFDPRAMLSDLKENKRYELKTNNVRQQSKRTKRWT